ncbi:hypothetical protein Tco_1101336, partial [Tanacetum coccineum]
MNVETLVSGSKNYEYDDKLGKDEVTYKVFDEMPKGNANTVRADYVE